METKNSNFTKILVLISFIIMIFVNAMANILPINGVTSGEVSDSYFNLFAPAGITFSIWSVIYILLAMYTIYQLFSIKKDSVNNVLLNNIGMLFIISSIANAIWIFSWHYYNIPLSMFFMIVILICLISISKMINKENLSLKEKIFVRLPFSIYFGWITVATVANVTTLLVSIGWDGFGISEVTWTIIILIVAMIIGCITMLKNKDVAYGIVLIWAYSGILLKHISQTGFSGQYPAIVATVIVCIILFISALIYLLFRRNNKCDN